MPALPRRLRVAIAVPALSLAGVLASCTQIPELDATIPDQLENADYPDLIPLDTSLFAAQTPEKEAEQLQNSLNARSAALSRRAAQLQDPIIDAQTRDRLKEGTNR